MSRTYSAIKNKHKKHSKVHHQAYLYNAGEPRENISEGTPTPAELEAELLKDIGTMRQEFWRRTNRMRNRYA